jgi:hypothetical protein
MAEDGHNTVFPVAVEWPAAVEAQRARALDSLHRCLVDFLFTFLFTCAVITLRCSPLAFTVGFGRGQGGFSASAVHRCQGGNPRNRAVVLPLLSLTAPSSSLPPPRPPSPQPPLASVRPGCVRIVVNATVRVGRDRDLGLDQTHEALGLVQRLAVLNETAVLVQAGSQVRLLFGGGGRTGVVSDRKLVLCLDRKPVCGRLGDVHAPCSACELVFSVLPTGLADAPVSRRIAAHKRIADGGPLLLSL